MYDEGTFSHPFFLGGYFILTGAVFSAVLIGSGMWLAWMAGYRRRNLCGDHSDYLVTRLPRPAQHWTIADFFLMFGTIIVVGSLASPLLNKPIAPTVGQATEVAPAEQASNPEAIEPVESAQQPGVLPNQAGVPPVKMDLAKRVGIQMLANATSFLILLAFCISLETRRWRTFPSFRGYRTCGEAWWRRSGSWHRCCWSTSPCLSSSNTNTA
ncbi:hypothetical protein C2E31_20640 [Rhodopirellula baltica]|nr:hypothetical protein C2E31_20640 [Rhodopirellula baltica]